MRGIKLLSCSLLIGLFGFLSFVGAKDFSFTSDGSNYTPSTFTTNGGVIGNIEYGSCSRDKCAFAINDSSNTELCYVLFVTSSNNLINSCADYEIANGQYSIVPRKKQGIFSSFSFETIGEVSDETSSESVIPELSVPSSFTSGITDLVNNFGSTVVNWLPVVILITLGVTVIFVLFRVVRSYARRSFKG